MRDARGAVPRAAVADAIAGGEIPERDDARLQGHDGTKPMVSPGLSGERRDAVEHDAGPHPVRTGLRPCNETGRVRDASLAGKTRGRGRESRELRARRKAVGALGVGEMGRDSELLGYESAGAKPRDGMGGLFGREPEPAHAGVDLEPGTKRLRAPPGFQQRELFILVDEWLETLVHGDFELPGIAESLQQHDACRARRLAQRNGLLDPCDRKGIRSRKRFGDRDQAVAVGVRLDDRDDADSRGRVREPSRGSAGALPCR
jgi:hypothetical protein